MTKSEQALQEKRIAADILIAALRAPDAQTFSLKTNTTGDAEKLSKAFQIILKAVSTPST